MLVCFAAEPDRETRRGDQEALEEIRHLFARSREVGHHGMVAEHDEEVEVPSEKPEEMVPQPVR